MSSKSKSKMTVLSEGDIESKSNSLDGRSLGDESPLKLEEEILSAPVSDEGIELLPNNSHLNMSSKSELGSLMEC